MQIMSEDTVEARSADRSHPVTCKPPRAALRASAAPMMPNPRMATFVLMPYKMRRPALGRARRGEICSTPKGMKDCFYSFFCSFLTEVSSRPERSAVEGPAVLSSTIRLRMEAPHFPFVIPTEA